MAAKRANKDMAVDALCIAGETAVIPGASLLAKGEVKQGLLHVGGGLIAKAMLGPWGLVAVAANSYCKAKTGKNLYNQFTASKGVGDQSLREEVKGQIDAGNSLEVIVECIVEDVEDFYHETALQTEQAQQAPEQGAEKAPL